MDEYNWFHEAVYKEKKYRVGFEVDPSGNLLYYITDLFSRESFRAPGISYGVPIIPKNKIVVKMVIPPSTSINPDPHPAQDDIDLLISRLVELRDNTSVLIRGLRCDPHYSWTYAGRRIYSAMDAAKQLTMTK